MESCVRLGFSIREGSFTGAHSSMEILDEKWQGEIYPPLMGQETKDIWFKGQEILLTAQLYRLGNIS
jgi:hypothetical protein